MGDRIDKLPLSREEMRSLVLDTLRNGEPQHQLGSIFYGNVAFEAVKSGVVNKPMDGGSYALHPIDANIVQEIVWDLIIEGIIRPGWDAQANPSLPFFRITEKGQQLLRHGTQAPYDPGGYLARIRCETPGIDDIIMTYLEESLSTFRIGSLLSSMITLGAASEKAFLLLIDAYTTAIASDKQRANFINDTQRFMINRKYDAFMKSYHSHLASKLPGDLRDDFENVVSGVFSMIRARRNDAGHPTGKPVDRDILYSYLQVFPTYLKQLYAVIGWLLANPESL